MNHVILSNLFILLKHLLGENINSLDKKLDDLTTLINQIKTDLKSSEKASTSKPLSELSTHVQRPPEIQGFVFKPPFGLEGPLDKKKSEFSAKPMDLSETFVDEIEQAFDYKEHVALEVNKLCEYPKKNSGNPQFSHKPSIHTYYYSRPTPQDVLIEERDWNQTNTSYSGSEIYEWNLVGLTDRQLTILVHRMLMYVTICKRVNNTDRTICKVIIAGFSAQLRGWWDNYMSVKAKDVVINAKAASEGVDNLGFALVKNREDVVYTLVLTILEHFNGRFTNQYETVRSLLNSLRCRYFREFQDIDLTESSDNNQQENTNACRCKSDICSCENDEFYILQSQFEDLNINTITSDNVIELLKEVIDNNLLNNRLAKQPVVIHDTSFDDLKGEVEI
ncbi:hypothetical protein H5410_002650 [Solanum commersonii]|uniref:DUF7746 domain-containing protein n=1 Tax=Solanum commersonii TaxID=4109 RepID=A0A9J6B2E6_SOLCO|nr:hypothetical protein H5410_002650 [Solanum commersonii]